jgi:hypothetical protein
MYLQAFFIKERIHANDLRQPTMWLASLILGCMSPYLGLTFRKVLTLWVPGSPLHVRIGEEIHIFCSLSGISTPPHISRCSSEPLNYFIAEIGTEISTTSYIQSFSGNVSCLQHHFPSLSILV